MNTEKTRVGFIGLGAQGGGMVRAIINAGFPTTLWARRPAALEPFEGSASIAASPAELAATCDLVGVCVVDDIGVEEVVAGKEGLLFGTTPGTVIAIHSTVQPQTCISLASEISAAGSALLDAPVSGGGTAAEAGRLVVMVGGDEAAFRQCLPVFSSFGNPVLRLGPVGSGQSAKLVNNALMTAQLALAHEAVELGLALGVQRRPLIDALLHASGASASLGVYGRVLSLEILRGRAALLLRKDVDLLLETAKACGAQTRSLIAEAELGLTLLEAGADLR